MMSTQDLRNKEVINIYDGKSLGYVYDIEINLERGIIEGLIVPAQRSFFSFFGRGDNDYVIKWRDIKRIGDDVILVDVAGVYDTDMSYDRGYVSNIQNVGAEDLREDIDEEEE